MASSSEDNNNNHSDDLLKLFSLSDVSIDPTLFDILHDLIRNGVAPDAVYAFLVQAMNSSKLGKKLLKARSKTRSGGNERASQGSSSRPSSNEKRKSLLIQSNQQPDQV